jgi:hypothetical protein
MQATETMYFIILVINVQFTEMKSNERKTSFIQNEYSCFYYQPLSSRTAPKMSVIFSYYKITQKSGKC